MKYVHFARNRLARERGAGKRFPRFTAALSASSIACALLAAGLTSAAGCSKKADPREGVFVEDVKPMMQGVCFPESQPQLAPPPALTNAPAARELPAAVSPEPAAAAPSPAASQPVAPPTSAAAQLFHSAAGQYCALCEQLRQRYAEEGRTVGDHLAPADDLLQDVSPLPPK